MCYQTTDRQLGDSLSADGFPKPVAFMKVLQRWLRARFKSPFKDTGDSLAHGTQKDGFLCLICSANTIGHAVFGDELWNMNRAALEKTDWFRTLVKDEPDVPTRVTGKAEQRQGTRGAEPNQRIVKPSLANLLNPQDPPGPIAMDMLAQITIDVDIDPCPPTADEGATDGAISMGDNNRGNSSNLYGPTTMT